MKVTLKGENVRLYVNSKNTATKIKKVPVFAINNCVNLTYLQIFTMFESGYEKLFLISVITDLTAKCKPLITNILSFLSQAKNNLLSSDNYMHMYMYLPQTFSINFKNLLIPSDLRHKVDTISKIKTNFCDC